MARKPLPRHRYADAVWESDLPTLARIVALAYADHADRDDVAWVALTRLMQRTGIRSRSSVTAAIRVLVDSEWLELVSQGRQHYASRYRLRTPQGYVSRTSGPESSGTSDDARGTGDDARGTAPVRDSLQDALQDAVQRAAADDAIDLDDLLAEGKARTA